MRAREMRLLALAASLSLTPSMEATYRQAGNDRLPVLECSSTSSVLKHRKAKDSSFIYDSTCIVVADPFSACLLVDL